MYEIECQQPTTETTEHGPCTLYTRGGFGNVVRTECRAVRITRGVKFAQHTDAVRVEWMKKGARKWRGVVLTYNPFVVVVDGQRGPQPDDFMGEPEPAAGGAATVRRSRYSCFDSRYVTDFLGQLEQSGAVVLDKISAEETAAA